MVQRLQLRLTQVLLAMTVACVSLKAGAEDQSCSNIRFTPDAVSIYEHIDKACVSVTEWQGESYVRLDAMVVAQTRTGTHLRFDHGNRQRGEPYRARFPEDFKVLLNGQVVGLDRLGIRQDIHVLVPGLYWEASEPAPVAGQETGETEASAEEPERP